jgi:hypothetical protein
VIAFLACAGVLWLLSCGAVAVLAVTAPLIDAPARTVKPAILWPAEHFVQTR